jgi:hypothetical protein
MKIKFPFFTKRLGKPGHGETIAFKLTGEKPVVAFDGCNVKPVFLKPGQTAIILDQTMYEFLINAMADAQTFTGIKYYKIISKHSQTINN